jgi:hypothetical protein
MGEFGKDEKILDTLPTIQGNFQQSAHVSQTTGRQSNAPSKKKYWAEKLKVPSGALSAATVRILPGEYSIIKSDNEGNLAKHLQIYYEAWEHAFGMRTAICSGGPYRKMESHRDLADPCHGCTMYWEERWERRGKGMNEWEDMKMKFRPLYAFSVAVLGAVHKIPARYSKAGTRPGQVKTDKEGNPVLEWVTCQRQNCEGCRIGAETQDGILLPWVMSTTQFQTIQEWDLLIGQDCTCCGAVKGLSIEAWVCRQCGDVVIDMARTQLRDEQLRKMVGELHNCSRCNFVGLMKEVLRCTSCQSPARASIGDVSIDIYLQKGDKPNMTILQSSRISPPCDVPPQYLPLVLQPLDMPSLFAPDSLETQASIWGLKDKMANANADNAAREYSQNRGSSQLPF